MYQQLREPWSMTITPGMTKKFCLHSLTRACRLINDKVHTCLSIQLGLLELLLFEIQRRFLSNNSGQQPYLNALFQALFALGYYGLMWVGELTYSPHVVKAQNIHLAMNKGKLLVILYSSKTHNKESRPQNIKIVSNDNEQKDKFVNRNFCPLKLLHNYIIARTEKLSNFITEGKQFFVYVDGSPVLASHARFLLKSMLHDLGLNEQLYGMHSLRIGHCSDLIKVGYSVAEVKVFGQWKSSAVYRYIRN